MSSGEELKVHDEKSVSAQEEQDELQKLLSKQLDDDEDFDDRKECSIPSNATEHMEEIIWYA